MISVERSLESQIFGLLFDHGSEAVFSVHRETRRILVANQRLEDMLGYSREALLDSNVDKLFADNSPFREIIDKPGLHEQVELRRLDSYTVHAAITVSHIDHAQLGPLAACIARDITVQRHLERALVSKHTALHAAHVELEQAFGRLDETQHRLEDRNRELTELGAHLATAAHRAAIGEFSAGVAHSLNNPLGALVSTQRQIARRLARPDASDVFADIERYLERSNSAVARLEQIVDGVRRAHRSGNLASESSDLTLMAEVELVMSLFDDRLGDREVVHEFDNVHATAPAGPFHHVASNLIDNALRATPADGVLTLAIYGQRDIAVFSVRNTGDGIARDLARRLFEPFVTGRSDGSGLGLCVSRRLARQWGGDVVYVPVRRGARFDVFLPMMESE